MKLLRKDVEAGILLVRVDTLDDLWTLRHLVRPGDAVTMDTWRTAEGQTDKVREGKPEKKRMRLTVRVEEVGWHDFDDHVRILGTIVAGPQDHGRHHTFVVRDEPGTMVEIHKPGRLPGWALDLVRDAEAASEAPKVVLLAIDDSEAQFAVLRAYGVQFLGSLAAGGQGKAFEGAAAAKKAFYDEAVKTLKTLRTDPAVAVVVVGPGWWREEFLEHAQKRAPDAVQGALTDGTAHGGRLGIQEALRRGVVSRVARDHRVQVETEKVEEVMKRIATGGLVAYGPEEVRQAVQAGAAEEVLVTDDHVRSGDLDGLLECAEQTRAQVHVLATSHEAGTRLAQFGGVAALLRFAIST